MSYLGAFRLHFAGRFQANVSTVNNDPAHFNNATFIPSYQEMQGPRMHPPNGWFNPNGDAAWRLIGCKVTAAWTPAGAVTSDLVLDAIVADSDARAPAKLVDLDSEQQLVSEVWGLQVRIADANGKTLMSGEFDPAPFADIWDRATGSGGGGDTGAGAMYQSVLTNLKWGDVSASPFLTALKKEAGNGLLSIKFNVDGFNLSFRSPEFMTGRIVGTIGPASVLEPRFLVMGRQFMATAAPQGHFFTPTGGLNFFVAVIDETAGCVFLDLGNAMSTSAPGAGLNDLGDLTLSYSPSALNPGGTVPSSVVLGVIPSSGENGYSTHSNWYPTTAGIVAIPVSPQQIQAIQDTPLSLTGSSGIVISEWSNGAFVRADKYVFRLSPNQEVEISVYASKFGRPFPGIAIDFTLDSNQLQPGSGFPYVATSPDVATPVQALRFDNSVPTDASGKAILKLNTVNPGNPRGYIDGQVYGIRPGFAEEALTVGPVNPWNFISILLWDSFIPSNPVTWSDIQPIFQQYANLYPVMKRFLDLGNYDSVVANTDLLTMAFQLDVADPNSMPVTRDLSPAKRSAILSWLKKPIKGHAQAMSAPESPSISLIASVTTPPIGGKAAASARRLIHHKK